MIFLKFIYLIKHNGNAPGLKYSCSHLMIWLFLGTSQEMYIQKIYVLCYVWNFQLIIQCTLSVCFIHFRCDFDFTADDTISAKTAFLDIDADLKLSVLFGLVEVYGSAEYLENHRKFTRQSRVTLNYRCRTHFKELQIKEMMSERQVDRKALNSGKATHLVSGIMYGMDAIFVFDRNLTDVEDELQIHRKLEAMVKFLPKASVASNIDERKIQILDNVKFTYHGDIPLDSEPSTFEEAIAAFKALPSKIGHKGDNCVPMTVFLYPLHKLTNMTLILNKPLGVTLVNQIEERLEKVQLLKMKCNDLSASPTCQYDERYRQKIDEVQTTIKKSEQTFKSQLATNVTEATTIDKVKRNVQNIIDEYDKSPKSPEKLDNNLSKMRTVANVLDTCVEKIQSSIKKDTQSSVEKNQSSIKKDTQSNTHRDFKYVLSNYDEQFKLPYISCFFEDFVQGNCHTATHQKRDIRKNLLIMRNRMKEDIDTFISKLVEQTKYQRDTNTVFQPGKPFVIRSSKHKIKIAWQVPLDVSGRYFYEVSYRRLAQEEWETDLTVTRNPKHMIDSLLISSTAYVFRVRCNCNGIFGDYSEVSNAIKTEYCAYCDMRFDL